MKVRIELSGIPETLLIPLYCRAVESRRPDALIKDERATELMSRIEYDWARCKLPKHDVLFTIMRVREFDRRTLDFLASHPDGTVVHIGCRLDTRFDRVDNGTVQWYDLDLPEVIALRRQLLPEAPRCHLIGASMLERAWMECVGERAKGPCLFLAEGVFTYFGEGEIRRLVLALEERFPGCELVFDAMTPLMARLNSLHPPIRKLHTRLWGITRGGGPETWSPGIRLLDQWFYFDRPEPRLGSARLMRFVPLVARATSILHYRLGSPAR